MRLEQVKLWLSSPLQTWRDKRAVKKAELQKIKTWLVQEAEANATKGYAVPQIKQIEESAKRIVENRRKSMTEQEIVQTLKDIKAGRRLREQKESRQRRQALKKEIQDRGR